MTKQRDPRVEKVAMALRDAIFGRGRDWYQAAEEVLDALEGEVEYEYAVQTTDWHGKLILVTDPLRRGYIDDELWVDDIESRKMLADWLNESAKDDSNSYHVVKRRKAGRIEDV